MIQKIKHLPLHPDYPSRLAPSFSFYRSFLILPDLTSFVSPVSASDVYKESWVYLDS